jgi:hypothetical protein
MNAATDTIARLEDRYSYAGSSEVARGGKPSSAGANNQN